MGGAVLVRLVLLDGREDLVVDPCRGRRRFALQALSRTPSGKEPV